MKGGSLGPVLLAGLGPVIVLLILFLGLFSGVGGWILWRPPVLWSDQLGAAYFDSGIIGITVESNSLETTGFLNATRGGPVYNPGTPFIRNYNPNGNVLWTKLITDIPNFRPLAISAGSNEIYLVGSNLPQNTTLLGYDLNGTRLWSKDTSTQGEGIVAAASNNVYFTGYSGIPLTNQSFKGPVLFVQKYDPKGNRAWTTEFSNASSALAQLVGIQADSSGVYILTLGSLAKFNLEGSQLWSQPIDAPGLLFYPKALSKDNTGLYISGTVSADRFSPSNGFVSKYGLDGNMIWTVSFNSPDQAGVLSISLWADSSGVYVSYESTGSPKSYVAKYDSNHNLAWSFETPVAPGGGFLVAYTAGELFLAGIVSYFYAFVQAFGGSASLIFFGINPPLSFLSLGILVTVIGASAYLIARRYSRRISRRPKSASTDRYRDAYRNPNPRA